MLHPIEDDVCRLFKGIKKENMPSLWKGLSHSVVSDIIKLSGRVDIEDDFKTEIFIFAIEHEDPSVRDAGIQAVERWEGF